MRPRFALIAGAHLAGALVAGAGSTVRADEARVTAKVECERASEPGRVRCDIEARAVRGQRIRWADAQVVRAPPFALALRARVGPLDATVREDTLWRWSIALAAKERGTGPLETRVRIVLCPDAPGARPDACTPIELDVSGPVVVGD